MENQDWATGPLRRQAVAGRGPRATGPSGRRTAGPWRAVDRGPLGRGPAFSKTPCYRAESRARNAGVQGC